MKKMIFLMLTLLVLSAASMNAQVTIGGEGEPHDFSVLELISAGGQGLRMPQLTTTQQNALTTELLALTGDDATAAKGLTVYNTDDEVLQIWAGNSWISTASPKSIAVQSVNITGGTYVEEGKTLQLKVNILPQNATITLVNWSVENGTGEATITQNGLLSGTRTGTVTVMALSSSGNFYSSHTVEIAPSQSSWNCGDDLVDRDGISYATGVVLDMCWTLQNLRTTTLTDGTRLGPDAGYGYPNGDIENAYMGFLYKGRFWDMLCPEGWFPPVRHYGPGMYDEAHLGQYKIGGTGKAGDPGFGTRALYGISTKRIVDNTALLWYLDVVSPSEGGIGVTDRGATAAIRCTRKN